MAKKPSVAPTQVTSTPPLALVGRLCLAAALCIASYLAIQSLRQGSIAGCGDGAGCQQVLSSKWAYVFGLPVSLLGIAAYLCFLIVEIRQCCARGLGLFGAMIVGAAIYFVVLQASFVGQFCPWCCVTHLLAVLGVALVWIARRKVVFTSWAPFAAAGAGLASLIIIQAVGPGPKTTESANMEGQGVQVPAPVAPAASASRIVALHKGRFQIDAKEMPAIGDSMKAKHLAVGLFDFTCPHCQSLVRLLTKIQKEFGDDQLAIVQLPGCYDDKGCSLQRLMLALWKEDPKTYYEIGHQIHERTLQADPQVVLQTLAGRFTAPVVQGWQTTHAAWAQSQLDRSEQIRQANKEIVKSTRFPQFMAGEFIEAGNNESAGHYYEIFAREFGLVRGKVPKLTCTPASVDLGEIITLSPHDFTLQLANPGTIPVAIDSIAVPNGMRLATAAPKSLAAGQTIDVRFLSTGPGVPGPANAKIVIHSDAETASIDVPVTAKVVKPYKINPATVEFGDLTSTTATKDVQLAFEKPVKLGPAKVDSAEFGVTLVETTPGTAFTITVTANPNLEKAGFRYGRIVIPLEPADATQVWPKTLDVRVRGRVAPKPGSPAPKAAAPKSTPTPKSTPAPAPAPAR